VQEATIQQRAGSLDIGMLLHPLRRVDRADDAAEHEDAEECRPWEMAAPVRLLDGISEIDLSLVTHTGQHGVDLVGKAARRLDPWRVLAEEADDSSIRVAVRLLGHDGLLHHRMLARHK